MKTFRLVASLAVFAGLVACHRETDTNRITPASFSLSIERTDKGIAAQCTEGCRWISVTADCAGCVHRIDAAGIGSASQIVDPEISFAFNVQGLRANLSRPRSKELPGGNSRGLAICLRVPRALMAPGYRRLIDLRSARTDDALVGYELAQVFPLTRTLLHDQQH